MNKAKCFFAVAGLGLFLSAIAQANEIQFTTLPEVVRTTVIHHCNIVSPEKVVRVVEFPDNIYEITVITDTGNQIVYVTADGSIVERPGTVVEPKEGTSESVEVTVTMDEIKSGGERYEFVQDQGPDKIYIDHQTGKRVIVKNTTTEKTKQEPGSMREKTEEGNSNQGEKNIENGQRTERQHATQTEQRDQGNRKNIGNGQERKDKDTSGTPRTVEKTGDQPDKGQKEEKNLTRTPGEQQTKEKAKGKEKASPTP